MLARTLVKISRYTLPGDTTVILNQLDKPSPADNETVLKIARGLVSVEVKRDAGRKRYIVFGRIHKPPQIEYVFIAAPARSVSEVRKLMGTHRVCSRNLYNNLIHAQRVTAPGRDFRTAKLGLPVDA